VNELKLEEPDLHDDPSFVINSIASYVRTGSYEIGGMEERERAIRAAAEEKVRAKLTGLRWGLYSWVLTQARRAVKNRENLRFARTKVFGVCRHLFRAIGRKLAALGLLDQERDVFYLTVDEIVAFVEGRAISASLASLARLRKKEYQAYDDTAPPPDRLLTFGAVGASLGQTAVLAEGDLLRSTEESTDPNVLKGTPCCPGIIEGVVRVVKDLKDAEGINGEILVTGRTDPGWVPLYPSCSGLLIERGSLLSHSAVVARELGLPTIVGVNGGLMSRLKTGDRVRVDAGKGEIRILG
jgi:rifampicin phosphotransferase